MEDLDAGEVINGDSEKYWMDYSLVVVKVYQRKQRNIAKSIEKKLFSEQRESFLARKICKVKVAPGTCQEGVCRV
jgi:hypothetical protein